MVGLAGMTAAALLTAAGGAIAHDPAAHGDAPAKRSVVLKEQQRGQQQPARVARVAPGLTIARDADTGVLRAPTDAEAAELGIPVSSTPATVTEFVTEAGVIAAAVPDEMHMYSIAAKRADGTIEEICLPGEQARSLIRVLARAPQPAPARTSVTRTMLRPAAGAPNE